MVALNQKAAEWMQALGAHACTDITGFGFIGHGLEMASASQVGLVIRSQTIPLLPEALEYAQRGLIPGGAHSNRQFFSCKVDLDPAVSPVLVDLLYDPQTSGGLLVSLPPAQAGKMVETLGGKGHAGVAVVGEVVEAHPGRMRIV